jgi:quinol-cytochrome oxidoreductase complex cytochrome b subunit
MICPVVSKEHFRSMRITLAFSVIALSFCIAFAVLTFAGILAQYTALCAAFFALVSSGLFLLYRFSRDISLRKLELTESDSGVRQNRKAS